MKLSEIAEVFDLPLSTLKDWRNPSNRKNKLYQYLASLPSPNITINVRLLQQLNRNSALEYHFTLQEITHCFEHENFKDLNEREKTIALTLYREGDSEDADQLALALHISRENIDKIFSTSPLCELSGFEAWRTKETTAHQQNAIPLPPQYTLDLMKKRGLHV